MKRILVAAGSLLALGLTAQVSSAASLTGLGQTGAGLEARVIEVHGVHRSCERGFFGWHRSPPWGGRVWCRPHREHRWYRWHRDRDDDHRWGDDDGRDHRRDRSDYYRSPSKAQFYGEAPRGRRSSFGDTY